MDRPGVFLATLGTAPQIVTAALTLLRRKHGFRPQQVEVFTTRAPAVQAARTALAAGWGLWFPSLPLHFTLLGHETDQPVDDVWTEADARRVFTTLYRRVRHYVQAGRHIHFLIAGGRKPIAFFGMVTAQLLFEPDDRLWHLYSSPAFLESRRFVPTPQDEVRLVPIPVVPWHGLAPAIAALEPVDDPLAAVALARDWAVQARLRQARRFVQQHLSPAERRVVALLVREGLSDRDLARRLHMSEKTVGHHLSRVYAKAATFWGLARVSRAQLVALLHLYFVTRPRV